MTSTAQKLEALLFLHPQGLTKKKIISFLQITETELGTASLELIQSLQDHGLTLVESETKLELATSPSVQAFVSHLSPEVEETLSAAAAETLALVAYRGPITTAEVSAVRGVDSRRMLQQLEQRELVRRKEPESESYLLTTEALRALGLSRREDLPDFLALSSKEDLPAKLNNEK